AAFTPFLFALSVAYAIVQHDLLEIDAMVKRGAYYLVLTGAVGSAYVAAVVVLNLILRAGAVTESPAFPVVFTLAVLLLFKPLRRREEVVGVLTAGPKRSGLFYTAADAEFLRALANSTAIALENASSYEALAELNLRLEDRVRERTAQLQDANRELADAYTEL